MKAFGIKESILSWCSLFIAWYLWSLRDGYYLSSYFLIPFWVFGRAYVPFWLQKYRFWSLVSTSLINPPFFEACPWSRSRYQNRNEVWFLLHTRSTLINARFMFHFPRALKNCWFSFSPDRHFYLIIFGISRFGWRSLETSWHCSSKHLFLSPGNLP